MVIACGAPLQTEEKVEENCASFVERHEGGSMHGFQARSTGGMRGLSTWADARSYRDKRGSRGLLSRPLNHLRDSHVNPDRSVAVP